MEHVGDESVKEQLHSELIIKTEVAEAGLSAAYVEIEIDVNRIKEEPMLIQLVKSKPALLVKEEFLEESRQDDNGEQCVQGTSQPAGTGSLNEACRTSLGDVFNVKQEPNDMDIEPTVLQHMDIHYTVNKCKTIQVVHSQVKDEAIEDSQKGNKTISCKYCGQMTTEEDYAKAHVKSCLGHQKDLQQHRLCQQTSSSNAIIVKSHLTDHLQMHTGKKPYHCGTGHLEVHTGKKNYQCETCDEKFACSSALFRHTRVHTGEKPYQCHTCDAILVDKYVSFVCSECGAKFTRSGSLTVHMRVHTGEKPFVCNECGVKFIQSSSLTRHMRSHTGEKPFVCSECGAKFAERGILTNHMRVHTGEKPFVCSECGAKFAQRGVLTNHMRVHTGEKPFVCSECGAKFAQRAGLTSHMRTHTGEKPFLCRECGAKFSQSSSFHAHMRRQHTK